MFHLGFQIYQYDSEGDLALFIIRHSQNRKLFNDTLQLYLKHDLDPLHDTFGLDKHGKLVRQKSFTETYLEKAGAVMWSGENNHIIATRVAATDYSISSQKLDLLEEILAKKKPDQSKTLMTEMSFKLATREHAGTMGRYRVLKSHIQLVRAQNERFYMIYLHQTKSIQLLE